MSGYVDLNNDDEETQKKHGAGRPNAWWAQVREEEEAMERGADTFTGAFRGVQPHRHGGSQTVQPDDVLGMGDLCWCGLPADHYWPGKNDGRPHPKEEQMRQMTATIDRRDLRAYHRSLQDFLLRCINDDHLRFRIAKNSVILYPPDGGSPQTVFARNSDKQIRPLQRWYLEHVYREPDKQEEEDVDVAALAEQLNDPVEHPQPPRKQGEPPVAPPLNDDEAIQYAEEPADPKDYLPQDTGVPSRNGRSALEDPMEWTPYVREKDGPSPNIITNGTEYRCTLCEDTDHPLRTQDRRSIGGHNRIYHTDTSNLYSPETRARATETLRNARTNERINTAIELLITATGYETEDKKSKREIADRDKTIKTLTAERDAAIKRAEDAEARLALMREAFTGLEGL